MREVVLIDTSVLCNLLQFPFMAERHAEVLTEIERLIAARALLRIPLAAFIEAGNHAAQNGDGDQRRKAAIRFNRLMLQAVRGKQPFELLELDKVRLEGLIEGYPDFAMRGVGLGDQSIIDAFNSVCAQLPHLRVRIWSFDADLAGYDRHP